MVVGAGKSGSAAGKSWPKWLRWSWKLVKAAQMVARAGKVAQMAVEAGRWSQQLSKVVRLVARAAQQNGKGLYNVVQFVTNCCMTAPN